MAPPGTATQRILASLDGVKPAGGGWIARCPAHDDNHQSLSIGNGEDGKAIVKCHAGCETEAIVKALGLTLRDLFADSPAAGSGVAAGESEPAASITYSYRNEDGEVVFQVVRKSPKGFFQRRPSDGGRWINDMRGVKRILYHLPEIGECGPTDRIFVVEGEKDAERLAELGIVATTSPGGAGKWDATDHSILHDRPIAIVPDNDVPGRAHADQVAARLSPHCTDIRVIDLPGVQPGGDISDWLAAGGTIDELRALVLKTKVYERGAETSEYARYSEIARSWLFAKTPEYRTADGKIVFAGSDQATSPSGLWAMTGAESALNDIDQYRLTISGRKTQPSFQRAAAILKVAATIAGTRIAATLPLEDKFRPLHQREMLALKLQTYLQRTKSHTVGSKHRTQWWRDNVISFAEQLSLSPRENVWEVYHTDQVYVRKEANGTIRVAIQVGPFADFVRAKSVNAVAKELHDTGLCSEIERLRVRALPKTTSRQVRAMIIAADVIEEISGEPQEDACGEPGTNNQPAASEGRTSF